MEGEHDVAVRPIIGNPGDTGWQKFCFSCGSTVVGPTEESVVRHWRKWLGGTGCPPPQAILETLASAGGGEN